jgi:hypothetical protein
LQLIRPLLLTQPLHSPQPQPLPLPLTLNLPLPLPLTMNLPLPLPLPLPQTLYHPPLPLALTLFFPLLLKNTFLFLHSHLQLVKLIKLRRVSHIFTIDFTDTFHPQLTRVGEIRIIPTL